MLVFKPSPRAFSLLAVLPGGRFPLKADSCSGPSCCLWAGACADRSPARLPPLAPLLQSHLFPPAAGGDAFDLFAKQPEAAEQPEMEHSQPPSSVKSSSPAGKRGHEAGGAVPPSLSLPVVPRPARSCSICARLLAAVAEGCPVGGRGALGAPLSTPSAGVRGPLTAADAALSPAAELDPFGDLFPGTKQDAAKSFDLANLADSLPESCKERKDCKTPEAFLGPAASSLVNLDSLVAPPQAAKTRNPFLSGGCRAEPRGGRGVGVRRGGRPDAPRVFPQGSARRRPPTPSAWPSSPSPRSTRCGPAPRCPACPPPCPPTP